MATSLQLSIRTVGEGSPPVLLTHGNGTDKTTWDTVAPHLSVRHRVVTWDMPGHGESPSLDDPMRYGPRLAYETYIEMVDEVVAEVGGDQIVLGGHSLGGYLSCRYALEHPGRVAALILISTGPGFRSPDARQKWNDDVGRTVAKLGAPQQRLGLHEDSFVMDRLADLACPTLVMVGALDTPFLGSTDYFERKVKDIARVTVDGAGHSAPMTHGDEIGTAIAGFLRRRLP